MDGNHYAEYLCTKNGQISSSVVFWYEYLASGRVPMNPGLPFVP